MDKKYRIKKEDATLKRETGIVETFWGDFKGGMGYIVANGDEEYVFLQRAVILENFTPVPGDEVSFIRNFNGKGWVAKKVQPGVRLVAGPERRSLPLVINGEAKFLIMLKKQGEYKFREIGQGTPPQLRQKIPLESKGKGLSQMGVVEYYIRVDGGWKRFPEDPRLMKW